MPHRQQVDLRGLVQIGVEAMSDEEGTDQVTNSDFLDGPMFGVTASDPDVIYGPPPGNPRSAITGVELGGDGQVLLGLLVGRAADVKRTAGDGGAG